MSLQLVRKNWPSLLVCAILLLMTCLMFGSVSKDTYTTDELLYLPTGYQNLTEHNTRLGFEHPPLVKDWSALSLLFLNLKPASAFYPNSGLNGLDAAVWGFGENFLFKETIDPATILFAARAMMIILTLGFAYFVFWVGKREFNFWVGLISLSLFTLTPLIVAHGRLVTSDLASAFGAFAAVYFFIRFLRQPSWPKAFWAGLVLGLAELTKFSMVLLLPLFLVLWLIWFFKIKRISLKLTLGILGTAALVIWFFYAFQTANYQPSEQVSDITQTLNATRPTLAKYFSWLPTLSQSEITRPFAEYIFGAVWQLTRSGAFGYFDGQGSTTGWLSYYPLGFLVKNPIPVLVLMILAAYVLFKNFRFRFLNNKDFIEKYFLPLASIIWICFYVFVLVFLNSGNTGLRYLLPIYPFLFLLTGWGLTVWWESSRIPALKVFALSFLVTSQLFIVLNAYPSFLSYFNPIIGGSDNGYKFYPDTDVYWGQDVRWLADWVKMHNIYSIQIPSQFRYSLASGGDYVGYDYSSSYPYYLNGAYRYLAPNTPTKGWIAISARLLAWGNATAAAKDGWSSDSYAWLKNYEPVAKIGHSIFVYDIE